jgi:hypothetical protein
VTDSELEKLLYDSESDTVERTQSVRDTDKFGEAICAFANDLPDHNCPGVLSDGNLLPQPSMLVTEKRRYRDQPFDLRPVSWATLEDIDLELFEGTCLPASISPEIMAENEPDSRQKLSSCVFSVRGRTARQPSRGCSP